MIPRADITISSELPTQATYWIPDEEDMSEEGIGFFRDTWLIRDVEHEVAAKIAADERRISHIVNRLATDVQSFDQLARAVESAEPEELPPDLPDGPELEELKDLVNDDFSPLEGLDLGVAGLVFALASIGCIPAASCRGHAGSLSWAEYPVVFMATDRTYAQRLEPLVDRAGCGFAIDDYRPNLLMIYGASIEDTISLAAFILDDVEGPLADSKVDRMHSHEVKHAECDGQLPLFDDAACPESDSARRSDG